MELAANNSIRTASCSSAALPESRFKNIDFGSDSSVDDLGALLLFFFRSAGLPPTGNCSRCKEDYLAAQPSREPGRGAIPRRIPLRDPSANVDFGGITAV